MGTWITRRQYYWLVGSAPCGPIICIIYSAVAMWGELNMKVWQVPILPFYFIFCGERFYHLTVRRSLRPVKRFNSQTHPRRPPPPDNIVVPCGVHRSFPFHLIFSPTSLRHSFPPHLFPFISSFVKLAKKKQSGGGSPGNQPSSQLETRHHLYQ